MADIKKINGIFVKDEAARNSISQLQENKVDKEEGKSLLLDSEIERLSSLSNYDDTELRDLINSKGESSFSGSYNDLTDKPEIPSVEGLATEDYVMEQLGGKKFVYITQAEYNQLTEEEQTRDDVIYSVTDGMLSYNDLTDKPEIPSIEGLATKKYVDDKIADIQLSDDNIKLDGYATEDYVMEQLGGKKFVYITQAEYNQLTEEEQTRDDVIYSVTDAELSYNDLTDKPEIPSIEGLATKKYVDDKIADFEIPEVDLEGIATEDYVNEKIAEAQLSDGEGNSVDLSKYATVESFNNLSEEVNSLANLNIFNEKCISVQGYTNLETGESLFDNGIAIFKDNESSILVEDLPKLCKIDDNGYDEIQNGVLIKRTHIIDVKPGGNFRFQNAYGGYRNQLDGEWYYKIGLIDPTASYEYDDFAIINSNLFIKESGVMNTRNNSIQYFSNAKNGVYVTLKMSIVGDALGISDYSTLKVSHIIQYFQEGHNSFKLIMKISTPEETPIKPFEFFTENKNIILSNNLIGDISLSTDRVVSGILNTYNTSMKNISLNVDHYFGCSSSKYTTTGTGKAEDNFILVPDLKTSDFKIGQGIAINNGIYIRTDEKSWTCALITDLDYENNLIYFDKKLECDVENTEVEHDNSRNFINITNYYNDKDEVHLHFNGGNYLVHILQNNIADREEYGAHHSRGGLLYFRNKRFIDIDLRGSVILYKAEFEIKIDYNFGGPRCGTLPPSTIEILGSNNVTIKNGYIIHDMETNSKPVESTYECMICGILVHGCRYVNLSNLLIYGCESDGIAVGGSADSITSGILLDSAWWDSEETEPWRRDGLEWERNERGIQKCIFDRVSCYYCGRQGLTFSSGADCEITGCDFSYTAYCRDKVTHCWWGSRNPGAGIDFEFESASDVTIGQVATSKIRRVVIRDTKLIGNSYTFANGMTEGDFLMENCILESPDPEAGPMFTISTGANAGTPYREEIDEDETEYTFTIYPMTFTARNCHFNFKGNTKSMNFGRFRRVVFDNCRLVDCRLSYAGRQVLITNSEIVIGKHGWSQMFSGHMRYPLIENSVIRFRQAFLDNFTRWQWDVIKAQFKDCYIFLDPPSDPTNTNSVRIGFFRDSENVYIYPNGYNEIINTSWGSVDNPVMKTYSYDAGNRPVEIINSTTAVPYEYSLYKANAVVNTTMNLSTSTPQRFIFEGNNTGNGFGADYTLNIRAYVPERDKVSKDIVNEIVIRAPRNNRNKNLIVSMGNVNREINFANGTKKMIVALDTSRPNDDLIFEFKYHAQYDFFTLEDVTPSKFDDTELANGHIFINNFSVTEDEIILSKDDTYTVTPVFTPTDVTNPTTYFEFSDTNIINGNDKTKIINAKNVGESSVKIITYEQKYFDTFNVLVIDNLIPKTTTWVSTGLTDVVATNHDISFTATQPAVGPYFVLNENAYSNNITLSADSISEGAQLCLYSIIDGDGVFNELAKINSSNISVTLDVPASSIENPETGETTTVIVIGQLEGVSEEETFTEQAVSLKNVRITLN